MGFQLGNWNIQDSNSKTILTVEHLEKHHISSRARSSVVVKALCYKAGGREFHSR
jgi:hypothetical protein